MSGEEKIMGLNNKVILSLAPVAGLDPLIPEDLVEDVVKSIDAGASMCHLHCKTREGNLTPDINVISEAFDMILNRRDVVVQASTGGVSHMTIEERCNPLNYEKVESASLNGGSTNLGEAVYKNSFQDIRYCAGVCYDKGILPEIEVFDIGMIHNIEIIQKEVPFKEPLLFNLVFGHMGGLQPGARELAAFHSFVPGEALWGVTHFGRSDWKFLVSAISLGAKVVRIGFEDSRYLAADKMASYNYQLVEQLVKIIRTMELEPATPDEAREILKMV